MIDGESCDGYCMSIIGEKEKLMRLMYFELKDLDETATKIKIILRYS